MNYKKEAQKRYHDQNPTMICEGCGKRNPVTNYECNFCPQEFEMSN